MADWKIKLANKALKKIGLQKAKTQDKLNALDKEEKEAKESGEKESKIQLFSRTAKRAFYMFLLSLLVKLGIAVIALASLLSVILIVVMIVALIVMLLLDAFTVLLSTDPTKWGGMGSQEAGEHYQFNAQDYNLLSSMYLKNIYAHAWLLTNAKDAKGSSASVPYMLGIVNYEFGPRFFELYDSSYEDSYSILEYYCGAGSNANAQGIYQFLLSNSGSAFYSTIYNSLFDSSYTVDKVWGTIAHSTTLDSSIIDSAGVSSLWSSYGNSGSLENSPFNIAVSVGGVISNYEIYAVNALDNDGWKGHNYKKYYEEACSRQGLDSTDEGLKNWISSSLYYLIHAGGGWLNDISEEKYDAWAYAAFDYLVYSYRNYSTLSLSSSYQSVDALKNLDVTTLKSSTFGDQVSHGNSGGAKFDTSFSTSSSIVFSVNDETLKKTLMASWADSLPTSYSHYVDDFAYMYTYYTYDSSGNQIGSSNRQAAYAIAVAPTMTAIGNLKLNLIFEELGKEYVIDSDGYVCNPADDSGSGSAVSGSGEGGDFDANKIKIGSLYYSNIRNSDWFAKLDNSEWTNPLGLKDNGGFYVSSRYGWRTLSSGWDYHGGLDLAYVTKLDSSLWNTKCPVYAMHSGTVTKIKDYYDSSGMYVTFEVTYKRNGVSVTRYITYMHMNKITVTEGQTIKKGDIVGYMGDGGGNYAQHLHVQIGVLDYPNGDIGLLDTETELPFLTSYSGYHSWDNSTADYSGYLYQQPKSNLGKSETDPNAYKQPS
jgi:murein DD-endopeptidase MepM/ murein hydrolase activator NlpD